ncbi:MAG: hypothetical protein QOI04_1654, partial [Verrucomicrobiota bacterium]
EIVANDIVDPLVHEMLRKFEFFLVERLDDELAIDEVLESGTPGGLDLLVQFLAVILRPEQAFPRRREPAHLRVGNNIAIHDGSDAIDNARIVLRRERTVAERREEDGHRGRDSCK